MFHVFYGLFHPIWHLAFLFLFAIVIYRSTFIVIFYSVIVFYFVFLFSCLLFMYVSSFGLGCFAFLCTLFMLSYSTTVLLLLVTHYCYLFCFILDCLTSFRHYRSSFVLISALIVWFSFSSYVWVNIVVFGHGFI